MLSNAATFIILPGASPASVEEFSKRLGSRQERTAGITWAMHPASEAAGCRGPTGPKQCRCCESVKIMQPPLPGRPAIAHVKAGELGVTAKPLLVDMFEGLTPSLGQANGQRRVPRPTRQSSVGSEGLMLSLAGQSGHLAPAAAPTRRGVRQRRSGYDLGDVPDRSDQRWQAQDVRRRTVLQRILADREQSITVCIPTLKRGVTIGAIVDVLVGLRERSLIDSVLVVDGASTDRTAEIARASGATVRDQASLCAPYGPVLGKGDAMWRALSVIETDLLCFFDGDLVDFSGEWVWALVGPLLADPELELVKASSCAHFSTPAAPIRKAAG